MINDDERDYAEERANLADMRREREGEAAFEALTGRLASTLRELSLDQHDAARASIVRLIEEVDLRLPPNAHRYELLARAQHTATLAVRVADSLGLVAGYDLRLAAQQTAEAYTRTHGPADPSDLLGRAMRDACARVIGEVESFLDEEEQREQTERDLADQRATEASLR
jgi:hypothetical protein